MTVAQSTGAVSDRTCMVHRLQVRSVKVVQFLNCRVLCRAFERLERHESKGSRAVLRGLEGSNALRLPDPGQWSEGHLILRSAPDRAETIGYSSGAVNVAAPASASSLDRAF
jgi:hypothetical protein